MPKKRVSVTLRKPGSPRAPEGTNAPVTPEASAVDSVVSRAAVTPEALADSVVSRAAVTPATAAVTCCRTWLRSSSRLAPAATALR